MEVALFTGMPFVDLAQTPEAIMALTKETIALADRAGYDIAWFAEHHFSDFSICASPLMMAMHCAGFTSRIKLGPGVLVLPLHDPMRMLQEIGMLDVASGGRAIVGIGNGHQPHEFRSLRLDIDARHEVFMESWDILEMAWRDGRVAYQGKHLNIPETFLAIGPLGGRTPDLYVAAHNPRMMARGAKAGAVVFIAPGPRSAAAAVEMKAHLLSAAAEVGVAAADVRIGMQRAMFIAASRASARKAAESFIYFSRKMRSLRDAWPARDGIRLDSVPWPGEPDVDWVLDNLPIGDFDTVAERLSREVAAVRPEVFSVHMAFAAVPDREALASVEKFATLIPTLKAL